MESRRFSPRLMDLFVRGFSAYAVELRGRASAGTPLAGQVWRMWARNHVRTPAREATRCNHVWQQARDHADTYGMRR